MESQSDACFSFALWVLQQVHADRYVRHLAQLCVDFWYERRRRQCASIGMTVQQLYWQRHPME